MAPPKVLLGQNRQNSAMALRTGMTTRSQNAVLTNILKHTGVTKDTRTKRKAEASPPKEKTSKRYAFANITNAITTSLAGQSHAPKKAVTHVKPRLESNATQKSVTSIAQKFTTNVAQKPATSVAQKPATSTVQKPATNAAQKVTITVHKSTTNVAQKSVTDVAKEATTSITIEKIPASTAENVTANVVEKPATEKTVAVAKVVPIKLKPPPRKSTVKKDEKTEVPNKVVNTNVRHSVDLEKSEDSSLYVSALEDVTDSTRRTRRSSNNKVDENENKAEKEEKCESPAAPAEEKVSAASRLMAIPEKEMPEGVQDFDGENWLDPFQVSHYAMDIFEYLKERECRFLISNYMEQQVCLSRWMRALLVDWMVEVQESFELNHETLYLAVKLVDLYLSKVTVSKETLQLLGAASLFISSKFDERIPPMVEDFLYICDGAYTQKELIKMEMSVLKVINFDLGIPLSYRFLRRYARVSNTRVYIFCIINFYNYIYVIYLNILHFIGISAICINLITVV
ncbi:hypothetical protein DMN91_007397 [Ooceraea biroi]|uniref:Cyclin-like domain-containing protein n=1 Tax=Ooceraea biroi TaxID=2015173 RepID=A0A3L8DKQ8_OOCBI|nr:hypothetical protein DMN91_007397 [Ooceraea biroi]